MKLKKLLVLIVVLAVLVVLAVIKTTRDHKTFQEDKKPAPAAELFKDLATSQVTRVTLTREIEGSGLLVFNKDASGNWTAEKPFFCRIAKGRMDMLLKGLSELKGEIRSDSQDVLEDYKISDAKAWQIILSDAGGKTLAHALVSPMRVWGARNFVRQKDSARVLSTSTDLLADLGIYSEDGKLELKTFTDLKINNWDSARVTQLEILAAGAAPLILTKKEDAKDKTPKWFLDTAATQDTDKTKVDAYLSNLVNWYAAEALDPSKEAPGEMTTPWIKVTLGGDPGPETKEIYLSAKPDADKKYRVKLLPEKLFYSIPESALTNLRKDRSNFLPEKTDAKKT